MIALDGPAAAGKTTVASELARRIHAILFDTGVIYRALALVALRDGIGQDDAVSLAREASALDLRVKPASLQDGRLADVIVNGQDETWAIRTPDVDRSVSAVSAHPSVRAALLEKQRAIGRQGRVVMVGRDIGTVVMPNADLKVWLEASIDERARRRAIDLERQGTPRPFNDVRVEMKRRDEIDAGRAASPMKPADDAVVIQTDGRSIDEVVEMIVALIHARPGGGETS
ncbi:MAG: (d)CMP kinase [Nitrolancea sp.]